MKQTSAFTHTHVHTDATQAHMLTHAQEWEPVMTGAGAGGGVLWASLRLTGQVLQKTLPQGCGEQLRRTPGFGLWPPHAQTCSCSHKRGISASTGSKCPGRKVGHLERGQRSSVHTPPSQMSSFMVLKASSFPQGTDSPSPALYSRNQVCFSWRTLSSNGLCCSRTPWTGHGDI